MKSIKVITSGRYNRFISVATPPPIYPDSTARCIPSLPITSNPSHTIRNGDIVVVRGNVDGAHTFGGLICKAFMDHGSSIYKYRLVFYPESIKLLKLRGLHSVIFAAKNADEKKVNSEDERCARFARGTDVIELAREQDVAALFREMKRRSK